MKFSKKIGENSGVTFTEVIVAVFLIAVSIGAITSLIVQSVQLIRSREYSYIAMNIAKSRIEELRQVRKDVSFADLDVYEESMWTRVDEYGNPDANGIFKRQTSVVIPGAETNLKHITVTVRYRLLGVWRPVSIQLDTYISPYV